MTSLEKKARTVHIHGVPLDLGGGRRGVDMGPSAVRIAGIGERLATLGFTVADRGDIATPIPETQVQRDPKKKYIREIATTRLAPARSARRRTSRPRMAAKSACSGWTRTAT